MSIYSLVHELAGLAESDNRGAIASLRRLLGHRAGHTRAYRYVVPHVPDDEGPRNYLLVAGLFGLHPMHAGPTETTSATRRKNMGSVIATPRSGAEDQATERRFQRILEAHRDQLDEHLRHAVGMAASAKQRVEIDYVQLFWDLRRWNSEDRNVQFQWARAFYATPASGQEQVQS